MLFIQIYLWIFACSTCFYTWIFFERMNIIKFVNNLKISQKYCYLCLELDFFSCRFEFKGTVLIYLLSTGSKIIYKLLIWLGIFIPCIFFIFTIKNTIWPLLALNWVPSLKILGNRKADTLETNENRIVDGRTVYSCRYSIRHVLSLFSSL